LNLDLVISESVSVDFDLMAVSMVKGSVTGFSQRQQHVTACNRSQRSASVTPDSSQFSGNYSQSAALDRVTRSRPVPDARRCGGIRDARLRGVARTCKAVDRPILGLHCYNAHSQILL